MAKGKTIKNQGRSEFNPFLKAEHVGKLGSTATLALTGFNHHKPNGTFGPEIVVEVQTEEGKYFDFSMREGSPNHRRLFRVFGDDMRKWKGPIKVEVQNSQNNRAFVAVIGSEDVPF